MTDALDLLRAQADARSQALPLPDAAELWRSGTRRRRRSQLLSGSALLVVLAALVGAVLVLPGRGDVAVVAPAGPTRAEQDQAALEEASRLLRDLEAFARDPRPELLAAVPLAPRVVLAVGTATTWVEVPAEELTDPAGWAVRVPGAPELPSALELLRRDVERVTQVGPHRHCAAAPRPDPAGLQDVVRYSTQPAEPASCLDWWTVDLFVRDGVVVAVSVDAWEP